MLVDLVVFGVWKELRPICVNHMVQVNDQAWHLLSYMMLSLGSHNDTELLSQFIAIDLHSQNSFNGLVLDVLGSFLALFF